MGIFITCSKSNKGSSHHEPCRFMVTDALQVHIQNVSEHVDGQRNNNRFSAFQPAVRPGTKERRGDELAKAVCCYHPAQEVCRSGTIKLKQRNDSYIFTMNYTQRKHERHVHRGSRIDFLKKFLTSIQPRTLFKHILGYKVVVISIKMTAIIYLGLS